MPSGGEEIDPDDPDAIRTKESADQYKTELLEMVKQLGNYPSIIVWVPFNEGWGQFQTEQITKLIKNTVKQNEKARKDFLPFKSTSDFDLNPPFDGK